MGNSFQEQFLKAGLVKKNKVNKIKTEKHKKKKEERAQGEREPNEQQRRLQQEHKEKVERDRMLNQQRKQEQEKKAIQAQIKQLIELNQIKIEEGEAHYNFNDNNLVRKIYLTEALKEGISKGQIAIVRHLEAYALIPKQVANKIAQRDERAIVVLNSPQKDEAPSSSDPYADFKIPDDLMW